MTAAINLPPEVLNQFIAGAIWIGLALLGSWLALDSDRKDVQ